MNVTIAKVHAPGYGLLKIEGRDARTQAAGGVILALAGRHYRPQTAIVKKMLHEIFCYSCLRPLVLLHGLAARSQYAWQHGTYEHELEEI
jgi:hypothetical protein